MTRQELINRFLRQKLGMRRLLRTIDDYLSQLRRTRRMALKATALDKKRMEKAIGELNEVTDLLFKLGEIDGALLAQTVHELSNHPLTVQEIGVLLSINHRILEKNPPSENAVLYQYAVMHGECAGENETFIGESGKRDYPVFEALQVRQPKVTEMLISQLKSIPWKPLHRYRVVLQTNGTKTAERWRPILSLVH